MASKDKAGWSKQFTSKMRGRILTSLTTSAIYFLVGYHYFPFKLPVMDSVTDRLVFTLRCQMFGALTLFMGIMGVGAIRGKIEAAADPIKGNAEHLTLVPRNILQNTVEQYLFHFVAQLVLCTYLSSDSIKAIPILVVLFVVARIVFKIGYQMEAMQRAYGFAATFFPTVITYGYCAYCFVSYGPVYGLGK